MKIDCTGRQERIEEGSESERMRRCTCRKGGERGSAPLSSCDVTRERMHTSHAAAAAAALGKGHAAVALQYRLLWRCFFSLSLWASGRVALFAGLTSETGEEEREFMWSEGGWDGRCIYVYTYVHVRAVVCEDYCAVGYSG